VDPRWIHIRNQLAGKLRNSERGEVGQVTFNELKEIATYYHRGDPGDCPGSSTGDIYNSMTQHIVLFEPDTLHLEVFFRAASPLPVRHPAFTAIPISFSHSRD
jgi:hypothetical protein